MDSRTGHLVLISLERSGFHQYFDGFSKSLSRFWTAVILNVFQNRPLTALDKIIDLTEEFSSSDNKSIFPLEKYRDRRSSHKDSSLLPNLINTLMELEYPINFENSQIIKINNSGGAVSLLDFGHFIKNVRKELSLSLMDVQIKSGLSDSTLSNLENAFYQNIKLSEILILEKVLKANGDLFRIIWNVFEFKARDQDNRLSSGWLPQERVFLYFIFNTYRWFQTLGNSIDSKWLYKLRSIYD